METDKIIAAGEKIAAKMAELATQYGPHVVDGAMLAVRIEATQTLINGLIALAALYPIYRALAWAIPRLEDDQPGPVLTMIFGGVASIGTGAFAASHLLSVWTWAALIRPEIWLAKKVLGL